MKKDSLLDYLILTNTNQKKLKYFIFLLYPFAIYINFISSSKDSSINYTWNVYNTLFIYLEDFKTILKKKNKINNPWIPEFFVFIDTGFKILKQYYSNTKNLIKVQYTIAKILDLSQKFNSFKRADQKTTNTKKYKQIFIKYQDKYYKKYKLTKIHIKNTETVKLLQSLNVAFKLNSNSLSI